MENPWFNIERKTFDVGLSDRLSNHKFARDQWPLIYILNSETQRKAYVGETTNLRLRLETHLRNPEKRILEEVRFIFSEKFNKSATLDIESNLIRYLAADGQYVLLNGNLGIANHSYYQKEEVYSKIFSQIWNRLRAEGLAKKSLEAIDNSDLFKYSPYKSLSQTQIEGVYQIIDALYRGEGSRIIIKGSAGTGKTIVAVFLLKLLQIDLDELNYREFGEHETEVAHRIRAIKKRFSDLRVGLVVPMSSFRNTLKKVFSNIHGLSASMVIGPSEATKQSYDLLVVDEAHRLRRRKNLTNYRSFDDGCRRLGLDKNNADELDWILKQSTLSVFFYDEKQSVKPTDVRYSKFRDLINNPNSRVIELKSQFRVKGGNGYVDFVDRLLNVDRKIDKFENTSYELMLFENFPAFYDRIQEKDREVGLSRMIAGYAWPWVSKKDPTAFDIEIEGVPLQWNKTNDDWINTDNAANEVGCIHTTQGYDLNYAGVIFGQEIGFDPDKNEIVIHKEYYHDRNGHVGISDLNELKNYVLNIYKTILLRGIAGTYIYVCDPSLREYFKQFINVFGSSDNISKESESIPVEPIPFKNSVPFYPVLAAAGSFSGEQYPEDYDWVVVPEQVRITKHLFAIRVEGESMNRVIPSGSVCLFNKYQGGSRNGRIVLVEMFNQIDAETGSRFTVKEYRSRKSMTVDSWRHESVELWPLSDDASYEPIVLDGSISYKIIGVFDRVLI